MRQRSFRRRLGCWCYLRSPSLQRHMEGRSDPSAFGNFASEQAVRRWPSHEDQSKPLLPPPATGRQQIMNESHEKSSQEADPANSTSVEAGEVLAAMEQTVEAAGALGAELERAKRLLRETENSLTGLSSANPDQASNASTDKAAVKLAR